MQIVKFVQLSIVPVILTIMLLVALGEMGIGRNIFNYMLYSVSPYGVMQYYMFTIGLSILSFSLIGVFRKSLTDVFKINSIKWVNFTSFSLIVLYTLVSLTIHFIDKFTLF